jgi:hypothetical protein
VKFLSEAVIFQFVGAGWNSSLMRYVDFNFKPDSKNGIFGKLRFPRDLS